jgi:hypothetical protein
MKCEILRPKLVDSPKVLRFLILPIYRNAIRVSSCRGVIVKNVQISRNEQSNKPGRGLRSLGEKRSRLNLGQRVG